MSELSPDRVVPHSQEAEEAVLGAVLISPDIVSELAAVLSPDDFFNAVNGEIWRGILSLHDAGRPIDPLTIRSQLELYGVNTVRDTDVLALLTRTPSSLNAIGYAEIVKEHSLRRHLLMAAAKIAQIAHSSNVSGTGLLDEAENALIETTQTVTVTEIGFKDLLSAHMDSMFQRIENRSYGRYTTGMSDLDNALGGALRDGALVILAGRPGIGKSAALGNMFAANAEAGTPAGFISIEMMPEPLISRIVAALAHIPASKLRDADMAQEELDRYIEFVGGTMSGWPAHVMYKAPLTDIGLFRQARRWRDQFGVRLVFVDYLQLMTAEGGKWRGNRVQEITQISGTIKRAALELGICFVCAAQLSRACEQRPNKRPLLSDLRESGSIEQDADVVMFIYRDAYYNEAAPARNAAEFIIAKNRYGQAGITVTTVWDANHQRFFPAVQRNIEL